MPSRMPHPIFPVLLDIESSRAVTLPYFHHTIRPTLQTQVEKLVLSSSSLLSFDTSLIRPCGFSSEYFTLQDPSWSEAWKSYINAVRERGEVSAAGAAPVNPSFSMNTNNNNNNNNNNTLTTSEIREEGKKSNDINLFPLVGTLPLPIPVRILKDDEEEGKKTFETIMMEFFGVDTFIPVHIQMYHVMRRIILHSPNYCKVMGIGITVPNLHIGYFINASKHIHKKLANQNVLAQYMPHILVFDQKGLQFQIP